MACLSGPGAMPAAHGGELQLIAGDLGDAGANDGSIAVAQFNSLAAVAVDAAGNVYLADGNAIRRISTEGAVTTIAGKAGEWGESDGAGAVARFNSPQGLAVDLAGNVYVADRDNHAIRKITPDGKVSTVAGSASSMGAKDGKGRHARFFRPSGIAVDASGTLFVSDTRNFTIRKISPAGVVSTIAGRAEEAGSANGPAASARFSFPQGIAVDATGNVFVADYFVHAIRKISTSGVVSTLAGQMDPPAMGTADGAGAAARFAYPSGLAIDRDGNLYVADSHSYTIRKLTPTGTVTTVAGMADRPGIDDGPGASARFASLAGVAVDRRGNVYVTDFASVPGGAPTRYVKPGPSGTVRRIDPSGVVSTFAGRMSDPYGNADGIGTAARFDSPSSIVADQAGTLYVADSGAGTVRKITAAGEVTTLAGKAGVRGRGDGLGSQARFDQPAGIALDKTGTIYVTDAVSGVIRRITSDGLVTTFAGTPGVKGHVDGVGAAVRFSTPGAIAVDDDGNLYVSDGWANNIRKVTPTGEVTTWANKSGQRGAADGPIDQARFVVPAGIAVDHSGNLYVCDYGNRTIRKITPHGVVSTLAGRAGQRGSRDGTGPGAEFTGPLAIAVDDSGKLYVADGSTIRSITPGGAVTTVAGIADSPGIKLGNLPGRLENVAGVALIDSHTLAVTQRYSVLKILLDGPRGALAIPDHH